MSKLGCVCGHVIRDQTDFLPHKAYIREDEDTQRPVELLAGILAQFWEAREQNREAEFIREFFTRRDSEGIAELEGKRLAGKPLSEVLYSLIYPFWTNYDRTIFECEVCGRLWVQVDRTRFVAYQPETDTRHVLWSRHNHNPYGNLDE